MATPNQTPAQQAFVMKVIWGAFTFSQLIYLYVIYTLQKSGAPANPNSQLQLWGPAIFDGLISIVVFWKNLSAAGLTKLFDGVDPKLAAGKAFPLYIICWGLNESVSVMGFVTAFHGDKSPMTLAPYTVAGVILNLFMFPKIDKFLRGPSDSQGPVL